MHYSCKSQASKQHVPLHRETRRKPGGEAKIQQKLTSFWSPRVCSQASLWSRRCARAALQLLSSGTEGRPEAEPEPRWWRSPHGSLWRTASAAGGGWWPCICMYYTKKKFDESLWLTSSFISFHAHQLEIVWWLLILSKSIIFLTGGLRFLFIYLQKWKLIKRELILLKEVENIFHL